MANLCDCPELNYAYVTDDEYGCGIKMYFEHTDSEVYINANAYYDFNCEIESVRIPIKCCPFCGKTFRKDAKSLGYAIATTIEK